jgi:hypothetical protein
MTGRARDKQTLLARNAALRAELANEIGAVRARIGPALHWVDQARAASGWAREHAPLLSTLAALGAALLLRRRAPAPLRAAATGSRLWSRMRLALTVGTMVWRFVEQQRARR